MRTIDISKGYDKLKEEDKLYLAQRGKLPAQHITDSLRAKLDLSGRASTVAYGANTGDIRTMSVDELESELERRRANADEFGEDDVPAEYLMPDLDNPHSERLDDIEANQEETARTQHKRDAARNKAAAGPAVPTLGHPADRNLTRHSVIEEVDDDEDHSDEEEFEPTVEEGDDAYTSEEWTKKALKVESEGRGLVTDGNKTDLIARLKRDDAGELEEGDEAIDDEE